MRKNQDIELLRPVAILLTLTQHLGYLSVPSKDLWQVININSPFWVSSRSFSIYLIHVQTLWFVIGAAYRLAGRPAGYGAPLFNNPMRLGESLAVVLAIICVAELNYPFIEVPIRKKVSASLKSSTVCQ